PDISSPPLVHRQEERERVDEVRCYIAENPSFTERLAYQFQFAVGEIAESAMDEFRGGCRGGAAVVLLLEESNREAPRSSDICHGGTGDASADNNQVKLIRPPFFNIPFKHH